MKMWWKVKLTQKQDENENKLKIIGLKQDENVMKTGWKKRWKWQMKNKCIKKPKPPN